MAIKLEPVFALTFHTLVLQCAQICLHLSTGHKTSGQKANTIHDLDSKKEDHLGCLERQELPSLTVSGMKDYVISLSFLDGLSRPASVSEVPGRSQGSVSAELGWLGLWGENALSKSSTGPGREEERRLETILHQLCSIHWWSRADPTIRTFSFSFSIFQGNALNVNELTPLGSGGVINSSVSSSTTFQHLYWSSGEVSVMPRHGRAFCIARLSLLFSNNSQGRGEIEQRTLAQSCCCCLIYMLIDQELVQPSLSRTLTVLTPAFIHLLGHMSVYYDTNFGALKQQLMQVISIAKQPFIWSFWLCLTCATFSSLLLFSAMIDRHFQHCWWWYTQF